MCDSDLDVPSLEEILAQHPTYITQDSSSSSSSSESTIDYSDCRFEVAPWQEESSSENEDSIFINNRPTQCTVCSHMVILGDTFTCQQCKQDVCMETCLATNYWVEAICTHCWFKKGYMRSRFNDLLGKKGAKKDQYTTYLETLIRPKYFWKGFVFKNPVVKKAHEAAINK